MSDILSDEDIENELEHWEEYEKDSIRYESSNYNFNFDDGPHRLKLIRTLMHYRDLYREKMNE